MTTTRSIYLGETLVARTIYGANRQSFAFVCPFCIKVWGRVDVSPNEVRGWGIVTRSCLPCGRIYIGRIPGSFFDTYIWWGGPHSLDKILLENPALLQHEFECHLNAKEKGYF